MKDIFRNIKPEWDDDLTVWLCGKECPVWERVPMWGTWGLDSDREREVCSQAGGGGSVDSYAETICPVVYDRALRYVSERVEERLAVTINSPPIQIINEMLEGKRYGEEED